MPSNAYKISQHIAHCQAFLDAHGDLDVVLVIPGANAVIAIDGRNVNVGVQALGQRMAAPALIIGQHQDAAGRTTNLPGNVYQATASDDGWNHNRAEAPEGAVLDVWRRGKKGTRDKGWREGEAWFVFDGAADRPAKPVQIVPDAILGWKLPDGA